MKNVIKGVVIVLVLLGIGLTYYKTIIQKKFNITNISEPVQQ